ncbi:MAG: PPC domain-containing protein [Alphaproteobacteria bacterium]|nr:PPC domain-containing protein [Alphaproteobacteria bacterium]
MLSLLLGCHPATTAPDPTDTTDTTAAPHSGWNPEITGRKGSIALVRWLPDAEATEETRFARGLWTDVDGRVVNLVGCLFDGDVCTRDLGGPGDELVSDPLDFFEVAELFDIHDDLQVGDTTLHARFDYSVPVYFGDPPGWPGSTDVSWDGELAGYVGSDVFAYAGDVGLLSPDPLARVAMSGAAPLELRWTPGGEGEVFLRAGDRQWHLLDDGLETFTAQQLGLLAPIDLASVVLSRKTTTELDASGNHVWLQTSVDQWLFVDYRDDAGWTGLSVGAGLGEDCADALSQPALPSGRYVGDSRAAIDDHDLGYGNPLTGWPTHGRDVAFRVDLAAGGRLALTYAQTDADASVYVLDSGCLPSQALAAADDGLSGDPEVLAFTATTAGSYVVVLDAFSGGATWWLETDVQ